MLSSLKISGFRCFSSLRVDNMRRINLIVGLNSAGKTCLLEALELLASQSPSPLVHAAARRGELVFDEFASDSVRGTADIRHAFYGRQASIGTHFQIETTGVGNLQQVRAEIVPPTQASLLQNPPVVEGPARSLRWTAGGTPPFDNPIAGNGTLLLTSLPFPSERRPVRFVGTGAVAGTAAARLWGQVAARPAEDKVIDALRIVEPNVERVGAGVYQAQAVFVRLKEASDRIPLGSLGDGMNRLLVLACQLVSAEHGMLLVDEIDTGLHVSAMTKMWRLVVDTAKELDVQVFATTHSDDCLRGLANVLLKSPDLVPEVGLHRVQRGLEQTVFYSGDEIIRSAEAGIEIR